MIFFFGEAQPLGEVDVKRIWFGSLLFLVSVLLFCSDAWAKEEKSSEGQSKPKAATASSLLRAPVYAPRLGVDPKTGQLKVLSDEEKKVWRSRLEGMLNRSTQGLRAVEHRDGTKTIDLQGRFPMVMLARRNADGTYTTACFDEIEPAMAFLTGEGSVAVEKE